MAAKMSNQGQADLTRVAIVSNQITSRPQIKYTLSFQVKLILAFSLFYTSFV